MRQKWIFGLQRYGVIILWICLAVGCSGSGKPPAGDFLVKVDDLVLTPLDFSRALELSSTAYPHNAMQDKGVARTIRVRLMNQLIEEMILARKARDLNITVTKSELDAAVNDIRKDYPDNQFQETFLENAVSFETWKKRLEIRLLMEKVIASELEDRIQISRDDIAAYYKEHQGDPAIDRETMEGDADINQLIVKSIRRKKAEDAYQKWIKDIRKQYKIEINKKVWEKILKS